MPKYTVCNPIKHDGKKYAVGASIDLTKAEAEALPEGTVEQPRAEDSAARKAAEKAQKAEAERLAFEQAEAARKAQEEAEAERLAFEQAEAARKAQEEAEAAEKAEADRLAAEQAEADRLAAEKAAAGNGGAQG